MPCKYVIGSGRELERALAAWGELAPGVELRAVDVAAPDGEAALQAVLAACEGAADVSAFVAVDAGFLNFRRLELMGAVRVRGIPMPALVERGSVVGAGVRIPDNAWIGAGAILQAGCRIGFNAVVGPGAIVCSGADVGQSAWIDAGVTIGHGARIGSKATIGMGVCVAHDVNVGALCVLDRPGRVEADVAAKTFLLRSHAQPVVIHGA